MSDLDDLAGLALTQGLQVGVDGEEVDPFEAGFDHAVDGVAARAADAGDPDACQSIVGFDEFESHGPPLSSLSSGGEGGQNRRGSIPVLGT